MKFHAVGNVNKCHFSRMIDAMALLTISAGIVCQYNPRLAFGLSAFRTLLRENNFNQYTKRYSSSFFMLL